METVELTETYNGQDRARMPEFVVDEFTNATLLDFPVHCSYRTTSLDQPTYHSHNGFELYLCVQGTGNFIAGERIHHLGIGTFTVVNPMALHLSRPSSCMPFHRYVLAIQRTYLEKLYVENRASAGTIEQWLPKQGDDSIHFQLNGRQLLSLQETLAQLESEINKRQPCYPLIVKSLLLQLFAQLGRYQTHSSELVRGGNDAQKRLVEDILRYMMNHYDEPSSTANLCGQFHVSRSYLFRIFKQNTGVTMNEFLVTIRMTKAKDLLQGTDLPITEIAGSVGFQDVSHFCHTFKRLSGMTPSSYRSAHMPTSPSPLILPNRNESGLG